MRTKWFRRWLPPVMAAWLLLAACLAAVHDHRGGSCRCGPASHVQHSGCRAGQANAARHGQRRTCRHHHAPVRAHDEPRPAPAPVPGSPDEQGCALCRYLAQAACTALFALDAAPRPLLTRFLGLEAPSFSPSPALSLPPARGPPAAWYPRLV